MRRGTVQWEIYFYHRHTYSNLYPYTHTHTHFHVHSVDQKLVSTSTFVHFKFHASQFLLYLRHFPPPSPNGPASYSHRLFTSVVKQISSGFQIVVLNKMCPLWPVTTVTITDVFPLPVSYMMSVLLTHNLICIMLSSYKTIIMTSSLQ